jgi:hypothetical protein
METQPKAPTRVIDSFSRNPEPLNYEFPESVVEKAKGITLADLLDNPATQCWLVSAISNASTYAPSFMDDMQPKDSHMMMLIQALLDAIPMHERQALFRTTSEFIRSRRQHV